MNMHNPVLMQSWEAVMKDDDHDEFCGGANSYKTTGGNIVFLTQAESYHHRGPAFAHYSQLEFECIVQLQEKVQRQEKAELSNKSLKDCGRKPRPTFPLGINHPLYTSHVGVIRMKMCTPMFARAPPPKFPGNQPTKDESSISLLFQVLDGFMCTLVGGIFSFV